MADVDLSEFMELGSPKKARCPIGPICSELGPDEGARLVAALATPNTVIPAKAIRQWLAARGHDVSLHKIASHRHNSCTCDD